MIGIKDDELSRRNVLVGGIASIVATGFPRGGANAAGAPQAAATAPGISALQGPVAVPVSFEVNGRVAHLMLDTRTTLLDALRDDLGLTGTKGGCDHGQCGACTVIVYGRRINSCLALAVMHAGSR